MPDDRACLKNLGLGPNLDQDDDSRNRGNRGRRLHCNAERTLVGIAFNGVNVCDLDHGEQREQGQTHHDDCPGCMMLLAATASVIWLEPCQSAIPIFKDT
jgi:hypothetical protein